MLEFFSTGTASVPFSFTGKLPVNEVVFFVQPEFSCMLAATFSVAKYVQFSCVCGVAIAVVVTAHRVSCTVTAFCVL